MEKRNVIEPARTPAYSRVESDLVFEKKARDTFNPPETKTKPREKEPKQAPL